MVLNAEGNIILHQLFESKEDRISHLRKVQNKNFPITRTFPFVKNSCFCNNFFFSFIETYVSFKNFQDLLNLHYKMKYQAKLKNFFSLNFQWLQYDIWQFQCYQRYLETESATWIWQKPKQRSQYFNWKSDQPWLNKHIGNNWLGAIFLSPGDSHIKGLLVLLHLGLEGVTEVDTDPKGRFVSFKVTPSNDRVLCVYALGIAPGNSCLEGVSLKDYKIIWKIKMREMKTK